MKNGSEKIKQNEFESTIKQFSKIEDARDKFWEKSLTLVSEGYFLEACIIILATWNTANFRYHLKDFKVEELVKLLKDLNNDFLNVQNITFEKIDFNENQIINTIKNIYSKLRNFVGVGPTGAVKIMALKNPNLFVMWDTQIRKNKNYGVRGTTADDYTQFLKNIKTTFGHINWQNQKKSFAKSIDEYNYVKAEEIRTIIKKHKLANKKI